MAMIFFNNLSKEEQVLSLKNATLLKKEDQGEFLIISNGPINHSPEVEKAINFLSLSVIKIIKRKNYLDELNKYKNNFFKSQADAGIGTFRYDIINNKLSFSPVLFKMIGYKEGDPVPSVEKHRKCIHPEDLDHYISTLSGAINEGKSYNFYFRCYNVSTNDLMYLQGIGDVIKDENGKLLEIVSTAINHTNQKKIERELQEANNFFKLVFNSIEHNLSVRNEKLEYVFTNKAYDKTFEQEMKHLSEVINNNFVSSNDYLNSRSFMLKQMLINYQTNEPFKSSHHYQRKNRIYLVQDTIFRGGNNKKYIVSTITDITESKKYQKA
ncbi:putative diguanylate cyclase [Candidatus Arcanobacter lacustris]|uniref:histidine kinase n=1 Tax=Candidatus Arcanibacter lacustris TaxID=1607817 RepID=A0A0F5MMI4_9RICK|nr:putative diguanylate cyclase [Candidatus Arcanobacter lacustris]